MPSLAFHRQRREALLDSIDKPVLLMAGGWLSRNYPANVFDYRADSSFLYFFANPEPDSVAMLDPETREVTLFLHERTTEDALWHGSRPSFEQRKAENGVHAVLPLAQLGATVAKLVRDRKLLTLSVPDPKATARAAQLTGSELVFEDAQRFGDAELVRAIAKLRTCKQTEEIEEMRRTASVTDEAHRAAMAHTRPGVTEQRLAGEVEGAFARSGCTPAYGTILSVRGEVLHNHSHDNITQPGDIVLLDGGAEAKSGYCSDVTRCWPVSGKFDAAGAEIYDIVLRAEQASIDAVRTGIAYRELHVTAARVVAEGLEQMGILHGSIDGLVESGAHALFFPHGVGHLIGLDVHDMEGFGDVVHYGQGRARSEQFGTAALRMDLDIEVGMTFTIEPGIYFVPAILHGDKFRDRFSGGQVNFDACEKFLQMNEGRGFGGIRIEDDVLATEHGVDVLTSAIPKERSAIEALVGSA